MPQNMPGKLNEQVIASDLLISAKTAVRNCAYAITETHNSNVKTMLKKELNDAISFHDQVSDYMVNKGYYSPTDVQRQIQIDMSSAQQIMGNEGSAYSV